MSYAIRWLGLERPPADIRRVTAPIPLWIVVCGDCGRSSRACERISMALDEWLDHFTPRVQVVPAGQWKAVREVPLYVAMSV